MPVSFVRLHADQASQVGSFGPYPLSPAVASTVPAGNLLLLAVVLESGQSVTSITKPAGEAAAWGRVAEQTVGGAQSRTEWWVIKTETSWPSGTNASITTTYPSNTGYAGCVLLEVAGADSALRVDPVTSGGTSRSASAALAGVVAGDLVVGGFTWSRASGQATPQDADTTGGAWSMRYVLNTRDNDGPWGGVQHKIATASGAQSYDVTTTGADVGAVAFALKAINDPPNAPTLTSMASGESVNRAVTNRASWVFSDPNPNDTQSAADVRYRQVGTDTWTSIYSGTPTQSYDFAGGTFAAADYEWQVRTYDALGEVGPWSTSGFFTAVDAPDGPTITEPANGASVDAQQVVSWSTAQQDAYRLRKVADNAGTAVTGTVYFDTGVVEEPTTRDRLVNFPTNNRAEHVQVQVRYQGVWSPWSDVLVDVSYTPPPTPLVSLSADPATGSLLVAITNPDPASGDPAAVYNEVWINDGGGEERRATGVPLSGSYRYWTPISGRDYSANIRVVAVAANGTTASS